MAPLRLRNRQCRHAYRIAYRQEIGQWPRKVHKIVYVHVLPVPGVQKLVNIAAAGSVEESAKHAFWSCLVSAL